MLSIDYPVGIVTDDHLWLEAHALKDGNELVRTLHPIHAHRVRILLEANWAVTGYRSSLVEVGERLDSQQRSLWIRHHLPKTDPRYFPNTVADPDRDLGTVKGTTIHVTGSYHKRQSDGWAHAVDIVPGPGGSYGAIHKTWRLLGGAYGGAGLLWAEAVREPWHWQWLHHAGILPGPVPPSIEALMEAHDMLLIVDNGGSHNGEAYIVGLPNIVDITDSGARATHGAAFEAAGRKMTYEHAGAIARKGYNLPDNRDDWPT